MSVLQIVLVIAILTAVVLSVMTAISARLMIKPARHPLWGTPSNYDLPYEDVTFSAQDGLRLSGWFIPAAASAQAPGPTIISLHGWPWNRMGTSSHNPLRDFPDSKPVDLVKLVQVFHKEGYNVLMFDIRNYGTSASQPPTTLGWMEKRDLLGAIDYVCTRDDVDERRIGLIGFSMGGNMIVFGLPFTTKVGAAIAVQPSTTSVFSARYNRDKMKVLGYVLTPLVEILYRLSGGARMAWIQPEYYARGAGTTPELFVQGTGDRWSSSEDVAAMAKATPNAAEPLYVETEHRFDGYNYVVSNPDVALSFF